MTAITKFLQPQCIVTMQFIILKFLGHKCVMDPSRLKSGVSSLCPFLEALGRICYLLIQAVGIIQFPVDIGLRSKFPCRLSTEEYSQLSQATCFPWLAASFPPSSKLQRQVEALLLISLTHSPAPSSISEDLCD